jgi:4-hydroxy-tetrahydrodipicolinate synthase
VELIVALATAFADDGTLDVDATVRLADHLHGLGVDGCVVGGTTGEGAYLADDELVALGLALTKRFGGEAKVGIGCIRRSHQETRQSVDAILAASPDALLVPPPSGSDQAEVASFYRELHAHLGGRAELWAYHWPARYPPGIDRSMWGDLSVDAFKDSSGDGAALSTLSADVLARVYVGASELTGEAARLGCQGVILAAANLAPVAAAGALTGDKTSLDELANADRGLKAEFPASLKRLVSAQVDFPLGSRAPIAAIRQTR